MIFLHFAWLRDDWIDPLKGIVWWFHSWNDRIIYIIYIYITFILYTYYICVQGLCDVCFASGFATKLWVPSPGLLSVSACCNCNPCCACEAHDCAVHHGACLTADHRLHSGSPWQPRSFLNLITDITKNPGKILWLSLALKMRMGSSRWEEGNEGTRFSFVRHGENMQLKGHDLWSVKLHSSH